MKIFVMSDIHSFYNEMRAALDAAGFEPDNSNHLLAILGDLTDRGPDPEKVLNYVLELLPTGRLILVRGNHEDLIEAACMRGRCLHHDLYNGSLSTLLYLNGLTSSLDLMPNHFAEAYRTYFRPILNRMLPYYETKNYIFCHAWIPVTQTENGPVFNPDWREADPDAFRAARWANPFEMAEKGLLPRGKTVVCGHWHCSAGWAKREGRSEFGPDAKYDIFYGDGYIAIDGATAVSGHVNVIVIEDNFLEEEKT